MARVLIARRRACPKCGALSFYLDSIGALSERVCPMCGRRDVVNGIGSVIHEKPNNPSGYHIKYACSDAFIDDGLTATGCL